jgi:type II secretory pathway predicted ATPase ExeA
MKLREAIALAGMSYHAIGRDVGMSAPAISRLLNYGEYPTRRKIAEVHAGFVAALHRHGVLGTIDFPDAGVRPGYGLAARRPLSLGLVEQQSRRRSDLTIEEVNLMQMDREVLRLFGLRSNPFQNDVEEEADVFRSKGYEAVAQALRDCIEDRGFVAVAAPSGSGKTTIWDGIAGEYMSRKDAVICPVQLKHREKLNPSHLCRALIYGLMGEDARIPQDQESAGRMLSRALQAVRMGGQDRKAVLYIDDAHFATASVLRQLKTFYEEKVGRWRLLAIVLIGLPTLVDKLANFPEVGNRVRIVDVPGVPVREYLEFKFRRVGAPLNQVFSEDGFDAFADRFRLAKGRPAIGQPLIINATAIRAMVALQRSGAQQPERITRQLIDTLPGGGYRRAA